MPASLCRVVPTLCIGQGLAGAPPSFSGEARCLSDVGAISPGWHEQGIMQERYPGFVSRLTKGLVSDVTPKNPTQPCEKTAAVTGQEPGTSYVHLIVPSVASARHPEGLRLDLPS